MKTLFFICLSLIGAIGIPGCSKSGSSSNNNTNNNNSARDTALGSLSAYIDGKLLQFDGAAFAQAGFLTNGNTITIQGVMKTAPYSEMQMTLSLSGTIDSGTYAPSSSGNTALIFTYIAPSNGSSSLVAYQNLNYPSSFISINAILNTSDSVAKGTFVGAVVTNSTSSPSSHTITNGEFNVPVKF